MFVLLGYWSNQANVQCRVQMEHQDRSVLDINVFCANLGQKCLQLLRMHALSCCHTSSYPYDRGNVNALNTKVSESYQGLATIGDVGTTHTEFINAVITFWFLCALYSQQPGPWNLLATIYSQRKREILK